MAQGHSVDTTWMWHPHFSEDVPDTAGLFVNFRRQLDLPTDLPSPFSLQIAITADTRYKLCVNLHNVSYGPVKGDRLQWYSDVVDIGPFLRPGANIITVRVLRFFYATQYAASFPRLPTGGLRITTADPGSPWRQAVQSSPTWECAIDAAATLRVDEPEDDFLHVYERVAYGAADHLSWVPAKSLEFQTSTGNTTPWNLKARQIPKARREPVCVSSVHNVQSHIEASTWASILTRPHGAKPTGRLSLQAGSTHQFDIEVAAHTTAFIKLHFDRPQAAGSRLCIRYAESYEEKPRLVPYLRNKGDRRDTSRGLYGPEDFYEFQGVSAPTSWPSLRETHIDASEDNISLETALAAAAQEENYEPFHWRTFRFLRVTIHVGPSELVFGGITMESTCYPLDVAARLNVAESPVSKDDPQALTPVVVEQLWETSIRTLNNCMHDCYEDCPFYEQLQYAMDTRSSCLFTYYLSADDRLARQAITQLHNSFNPLLGLTASRSPSHNAQHIPHFSLYWICMLSDHLAFYGDVSFTRPMVTVVDGILGHFETLLDSELGLVRVDNRPGLWHFTDWVDEWRPYGVPPAAEQTGFSTYTSCLYAFSLRRAAALARGIGRPAVADEYLARADGVARAVAEHCFDGAFFTDGLARWTARREQGTLVQASGPMYSQHSQVWAVLSGAAAVVAGGADDAPAAFSQELLRPTLATGPRSDSSKLPASALSMPIPESPPCSSLPSSSASSTADALKTPGTLISLPSRSETPLSSVHAHAADDLSAHEQQEKTRVQPHQSQGHYQLSDSRPHFISTSISMSHYTFRALSQAGGSLYDDYFLGRASAGAAGAGDNGMSDACGMWAPWQALLALNLTTWQEDSVSQRSDCHAWGSAPLFEFLAEVAGIRATALTDYTAADHGVGGWLSGITLQPRPKLFKKLNASVPLRRRQAENATGDDEEEEGGADLLLHISWDDEEALTSTVAGPAKKIVLELENNGAPVHPIPLTIRLPGQPERSMYLLAYGPLEFRLSLEESVA